MNTLRTTGYGLLFALTTLSAACANDALVGEQDDEQDDGGDGDGEGDGDDEQEVTFDCPEVPPTEGASCSHDGATCEYDDCVSSISIAICSDGRWMTDSDGCPSPWEETCPDSPPAAGDACVRDSVALGCTYDCASGLPADHGLEATCTSSGVFALKDDACQLCGGVANPAGCSEQNPCEAGFACLPPAPPGGGDDSGCKSSGCSCDAGTNTWSCLPDCGGFHCVPDDETACAGTHNPQGCSDANPCAEGLSCMVPLEPVCLPSSCTCNASGGWDCVEDCNGGLCR